MEMTFACKRCKKCFRKDAAEFEEADEYCPHCDNHFVIEAVEPKAAVVVEAGRGHDARVDASMIRDERTRDRARPKEMNKIWDLGNAADRLG